MDVSKNGYPHKVAEIDGERMDLGAHYFQTNPYPGKRYSLLQKPWPILDTMQKKTKT